MPAQGFGGGIDGHLDTRQVLDSLTEEEKETVMEMVNNPVSIILSSHGLL